MNDCITMQTVQKRLDENLLSYKILRLQNDFTVICTRRGGRILGPFEPETGESVWWLNGSFSDAQSFRKFLDDGEWNIGGDRLWIAPEMPLFIPRRDDFFGSYTVQPQIDPGSYTIMGAQDSVVMRQDVTAMTFEVDCKEKNFSVTRQVWQADDPLRCVPDCDSLLEGVRHCGLRQRVTLTAKDQDKNVYLEPWILTQVNPPGKLSVPLLTHSDFVDYYEPVPSCMYRIKGNCLNVDATGNRKYKIGLRAADLAGRAAYTGELKTGGSYLFMRFYGNDPSNLYCGDPYDRPGLYGCSLFFYNDDGAMGGFSEFENAGTTISGDTGLAQAVDDITYHLYFGDKKLIERISHKLIG